MGQIRSAIEGWPVVTTQVRVRGIYATALTQLLRENEYEVVQASDPIRDRFDGTFEFDPASVSIETTRDRQGVGVFGPRDAVADITNEFESIAIDAFRWNATVPRGAVFDAEVLEAGGGRGAVVDLGEGERGYLKYDDVDGYVDAGNRYRVQVHEPTPPWDDDRPLVRPSLEVRSGLCTLSRDRTGVSADVPGDRGTELVGMTDLLSVEVPDGWGLRWNRAAAAADLDALGAGLERVVERARVLESDLVSENHHVSENPDDVPSRLASPEATAWVWFGRESRFSLDEARRSVTSTMPGHHRIKAGSGSASVAVDFVETICDGIGGDDEFPFGAVTRGFGPVGGDRLELGHGKPDGRLISLGTGELTEWSEDGSVTLEREMRGGGTYDALDTPIEEGDVAVTKLREGRWWYPTTYRDEDGNSKGTYVNVCTPVELFPKSARYVDLYVDVIRHADGTVEVVDQDELAEAEREGLVDEELAAKARTVATAVERALSK